MIEKTIIEPKVKPKINLNEMAAKIEEFFNEGMSDEDIGKKLDSSADKIRNLRMILGLKYKNTTNVFEKSKTMSKMPNEDSYEIKFKISPELFARLDIKTDEKYEYFAAIMSKKTIQLTILERD